MIIVNLKGGLGNQLFQYATGRRLSLKHSVPLKFDLNFLRNRNPDLNITFRDFNLDVFPNLNIEVANEKEVVNAKYFFGVQTKSRVANRLLKRSGYYKEKKFSYNHAVEKLGSEVYLDGYWQSEKYFTPIEETLRNDLQFPSFSVEKNNTLLQHILADESVCINVRRNEFLTNKQHGFLGEDFVYTGVQRIVQRVSSPSFYVFSDDVEWCENNLRLPEPFYFIDHSHLGEKYIDYLHLMASCKHFILSNSSYAWWAAWLNNRTDKIVIAPQKWFNDGPRDTQDLFPESWIRL